jgi:16S rRNA U1498 N3-methylase RsmE
MFTDNMGRRERERKRWNENNAAFPNKTGTIEINAAQKSRRNHNPLLKTLMKHINNI